MGGAGDGRQEQTEDSGLGELAQDLSQSTHLWGGDFVEARGELCVGGWFGRRRFEAVGLLPCERLVTERVRLCVSAPFSVSTSPGACWNRGRARECRSMIVFGKTKCQLLKRNLERAAGKPWRRPVHSDRKPSKISPALSMRCWPMYLLYI